MYLNKPQRAKDRKLLDSYHGIPCQICGTMQTTVGHHVTTKGAGGGDTKNNLMALCHIHHQEIHKSRRDFFAKYEKAQEWAEINERFELIKDDDE